MSTFVQSSDFSQGYIMLLKGGSEIVLPSCNYYRDGDKILGITEEKRNEFEKIIKTYAELTLRTIIMAYKEVSQNDLNNWDKTEFKTEGKEIREVYEIEESGFILLGIVGIQDILKDGVDQAVLDCLRARINVIMVTGDNLTTACAIAKSCNIIGDKSRKSKALLGEVITNLI